LRQRIKATANDLFVAHGFRGLTFGLVAARLGIPRPNIHYYFPTKIDLAEEVLADHAAAIVRLYAVVWLSPDTPLPVKLSRSLAAIGTVYRRYNPPGDEGHPWGLLARFHEERDALTPGMRQMLRRTGRRFEACARVAVCQARARRELASQVPVAKVTLLLSSTIRFAGALTTQAGGFRRVEEYYEAIADMVGHAYGTDRWHAAAPAPDVI
jgi:AcrR family transcriptional regulator